MPPEKPDHLSDEEFGALEAMRLGDSELVEKDPEPVEATEPQETTDPEPAATDQTAEPVERKGAASDQGQTEAASQVDEQAADKSDSGDKKIPYDQLHKMWTEERGKRKAARDRLEAEQDKFTKTLEIFQAQVKGNGQGGQTAHNANGPQIPQDPVAQAQAIIQHGLPQRPQGTRVEDPDSWNAYEDARDTYYRARDYLDHQDRQLSTQVQQQNAFLAQASQVLDAAEAEIRAETPDYDDAMRYVGRVLAETFRRQGVSSQDIPDAIRAEVARATHGAVQRGLSPAAELYQQAKIWGFTGPAVWIGLE